MAAIRSSKSLFESVKYAIVTIIYLVNPYSTLWKYTGSSSVDYPSL
jgi:hypothetical protein